MYLGAPVWNVYLQWSYPLFGLLTLQIALSLLLVFVLKSVLPNKSIATMAYFPTAMGMENVFPSLHLVYVWVVTSDVSLLEAAYEGVLFFFSIPPVFCLEHLSPFRLK